MRERIQCPFCFENFSIEIFAEDGVQQELIYDCEVCCHPIEIKVRADAESQTVSLDIHKSTGFN
jgi:hypothetical protein